MQRTIKPNKSEEPKDAKVKVDLTISGEALKQALKPKEDNHIDLGPKKIRYQKLGGGSLRMLNRIIKPNQIFSAYPEEIPEAFNRWIKPLDPLPEKKGKVRDVVIAAYSLRPYGDNKEWFDVLDENGKVMNAKPLGIARAEQLIKDLS